MTDALFPDDETPPTEQGPLVDEIARTRWPTVIGVISIIYAIIGLTCAGFQIGWLGLQNLIPEMWRGGVTWPLWLRLMLIALAVPLLVAGGMLLAGGIGLVRRKRSSVSLLRKWAVFRLVLLVLGVIATVVSAPAQMEMQRQGYEFRARLHAEQGWPPPPQQTDQERWFWIILPAGVMTVLIAIYPLFVGFYLSRKKINDEVAEWR
jgi:hypothetical protein